MGWFRDTFGRQDDSQEWERLRAERRQVRLLMSAKLLSEQNARVVMGLSRSPVLLTEGPTAAEERAALDSIQESLRRAR